jgi:hypothetical protein
MNRAALESELLAWMASGEWAPDPKRFDRIALELFRFQFEHCDPYARLCRSLDIHPDQISCADEIPAVPTGAFKEFELRCFEAADTVRTFRTSGTSTDRPGELHLDRLELYEASLLASLRHSLLVEGTGRPMRMRILAPSPREVPDSSLSYMFGALIEAEGGPASGFDLHDGKLDLAALRKATADAQRSGEACLIAGTAFAFVHLLDAVGEETWALPNGSRVMETGGFKGRSREVPRELLHRALSTHFGIPEASILNQYGMTELGSQFYDSTIVDPTGPRRKLAPPWTRVRVVDPVSGRDLSSGEIGLILIQDLANTGSIAAIQTADLGLVTLDGDGNPNGFEILGRDAGAETRGCSIATDVMLEAARDAGR